jgi:hypothetical protein
MVIYEIFSTLLGGSQSLGSNLILVDIFPLQQGAVALRNLHTIYWVCKSMTNPICCETYS